jgi:NADH-quinone oxidoreductase subunit E
VKPGPQIDRRSSEPLGEVKTLTDPALFDGSLVGAWRKRFEEQASREAERRAVEEAATSTERAASDPKPAKPSDAGRAVGSEAANTPAKKAKEGETPVGPNDPKGSADPSKASVASNDDRPENRPAPQSGKSYTATPSKPEEGRRLRPPTAPRRCPERRRPRLKTRRDGSESKPAVEVDKPPKS